MEVFDGSLLKLDSTPSRCIGLRICCVVIIWNMLADTDVYVPSMRPLIHWLETHSIPVRARVGSMCGAAFH